MDGPNPWLLIVILALAFAIFVANSVFLGNITKAIKSGGSNLNLKAGPAEGFLWINAILAGLIGLALCYYVYVVFAQYKSSPKGVSVPTGKLIEI